MWNRVPFNLSIFIWDLLVRSNWDHKTLLFNILVCIQIESLHTDSFDTLFTKNNLILYPVMVIVLAIVTGILFDLTKWTLKKAQKSVITTCRSGGSLDTALKMRRNALKTFDTEVLFMRKEIVTIKQSVVQLTNILEKQIHIAQDGKISKNESLI